MVEFTFGFGILQRQALVRAAGSAFRRAWSGHDRTVPGARIRRGTLEGPWQQPWPGCRTAPYTWSITASPDTPRATLATALRAHLATCAEDPGPVQIWLEEVQSGDDTILAELGFEPYRDLLQLRCELPAAPSGLTTRGFTLGDADAFLAVNNRAFHWHPEQSGMTRADLDARMAEDWFDPEGFRLLERDGRLAGFCWTKIHPDLCPPAGEIYVIAVDPDFHGQGLGGPMTLAGLEHLAAQDLGVGLLYVESDNVPALRTYRKLGFTDHAVNRAYHRPGAPADQP